MQIIKCSNCDLIETTEYGEKVHMNKSIPHKINKLIQEHVICVTNNSRKAMK